MTGVTQAVFMNQRSFATIPGAPTIGTATAGELQATVAFTAPASDGGSPITLYTATSSPGSITGTAASSPVTVTGLSGGTAYTFTVTATNAVGTGPASAASNSVTPTSPQYLFGWGNNYRGTIGINVAGPGSDRSSPIQVGSLGNWQSAVSSSAFSIAVKTDGTLWTWGRNFEGPLGLNNATDYSSPKQVGAGTTWETVAVGGGSNGRNAFAIKTDGTLWSWGNNDNGELGQNNLIFRSSPTQVGSLTNWSKISSGQSFCVAIKTDGTMWSWGSPLFGRLGQNNTTYRSSPTQIGALTTWAEVSCGVFHALAVKTDGTLWTWGRNYNGQLGLNLGTGEYNNKSSPVQVGALTDWSKPFSGGRLSLAIKTNNTIWAWGLGNYGLTGQNNTVWYSSPKQIGALTNWLSATAGYYSCAAVKTDKTLWSWGRNNAGQLGQNDTANRSSPTQVGSSTTWVSVRLGAGASTTLAISN